MTSRQRDEGRERLKLLYDISRRLGASLDIAELMREILALTIDCVGASNGSIFIFDQEGQVQKQILIRQELPLAEAEKAVATVLEKGLAGWVRQHKQATIVHDTAGDKRWTAFPNDEGVRSAIAVPFLHADSLVGLLTLVHPEKGYFRPDHLDLLTAIASQAASAIEKARLYQQTDENLRQRVQELSLLLDIAEALSSSLDV